MISAAEAELVQGFQRQVWNVLVAKLGLNEARKIWTKSQLITDLNARLNFYVALLKDLEDSLYGVKPTALSGMQIYKWAPVDIVTFLTHPYYLNKKDSLYPKVVEELEIMNQPQYQEIVLTGGIGCAKTTAALYTQAYQLYLLSCMVDPHAVFGLDRASEILIIFQSINGKISKASYDRFVAMIEESRYFQEKFPYDKNLSSKMVFPNRIEVVPISGAETGAIGQNVIGGMIDELNYMSIVENSRQSVDSGTYNQAVALYNSIARRRKSRFMKAGAMPGKLCLVSSKRYPGQFTDLKEEEAKRDKTIYIYDYRVWDIKPKGSFSGVTFKVFTGDEARKPRVLEKEEDYAGLDSEDQLLIMDIPIEFRDDFDKDIINALREIAGVSTLARHPYFLNTEAVAESFGKHKSIFSQERVDFVQTQLKIFPKNFKDPHLPRYVHIDLAISGDSAGVVIGTCMGFRTMRSLGYGDTDEMVPLIHVDGILEVAPPKNGEIQFWKIRQLLVKLRDFGLNIQWVSFDSFQSKDSMQLLRQQGFATGLLSMDTSNAPYDTLKTVTYAGALAAPEHARCRKEMVSLERIAKTGKIDHPANGSKDCSDSLAGVAHGLYSRREVWAMHNVPVVDLPKKDNLKRDEQQAA